MLRTGGAIIATAMTLDDTDRQLIASLLGEPGRLAQHDTTGRWDLLAELQADAMAALSKLLERVRLTAGIRNTETSILLSSYR